MKKLLLAIGVVLLLSSLASAQVLMGANTLGAGKWGYLGAINYDMYSTANSNLYGVGGYAGYGVMNNLDVYAKLGYADASNPPAGFTPSGWMEGLAAKYAFINEGKGSPVSLAGVLGYQASTTTVSGLLPQTIQGDIGIGAIVSKVMVPWVPYGALVYHSLSQSSLGVASTGSNVEVAVGTQMLLSASSAVIGEVSYNSYSLETTYTDTQISLGYSAKI